MHIYEVSLLVPPYKTYFYINPSYLPENVFRIGQRVVVPLQKRLVCGVILGERRKENTSSLKPIIFPLDRVPLFSKEHMTVIEDLALHLVEEIGFVLGHILPSPLRSSRVYFLGDDYKLSIEEFIHLSFFEAEKIANKWLQGLVEISLGQRRKDFILSLNQPPPWPIRPRAIIQQQILEYLYVNGAEYKSRIVKKIGPSASGAISSLLRQRLIRQYSGEEEVSSNRKREEISVGETFSLSPTPSQMDAINCLLPKMSTGKGEIALLFGVTGSGKTLVLMHLLKKCIEMGRSSLVLLPEVALAGVMYREITRAFPKARVFIYHGYLSPSKRASIFSSIASSSEPTIVVGTRSAVFLPLNKVGLIVMDEEHDSSFKQEDSLRYHTRDVAYLFSQKWKALLLLSSATPDIRTYYSGDKGLYDIVRLPSRVGERRLPQISIIDLNTSPPVHGPFAEKSYTELSGAIEKGEQVIILLNRRGFAPLIYCLSCQEVIKCPGCAVSMTYHKKIERMVCHYCGRMLKFPSPCPVCGATNFVPLQQGTEQVEEFLVSSFGSVSSIIRLDRDTFRREEDVDRVLSSFARGKYQILIGTQMCSKGHNFPGVSLVIVVDGDVGLGLPDFRATERTFQLLLQVAGRSGRGEREGRVYIQTRNPSHYCWQYLLENDYNAFYRHEIQVRKRLKYPPFSKLTLIRCVYPIGWEKGDTLVEEVKRFLLSRTKDLGIRLLGPAPAPIFIVNNKKRYHTLLKGDSWAPIRFLVREILSKFSSWRNFKLQIDMDPYHML